MKAIKQVYVPYWEWEDWKNGMWGKSQDYEKDLRIAIEFTGDHKKYGKAMMDVVFKWPRTMLNSLTNPYINKKAFVGHCAVSLKKSIPEHVVRDAWKFLTEEQRTLANLEAEKAIIKWQNKQKKEQKNI